MNRVLQRYKRKHGIHHPLLAIDFENDVKTGLFLCAGIYGDIRKRTSRRENGVIKNVRTTERIEKYYTNQTEFENFILSIPKNSCIITTFNLSYDRLYFDNICNQFDTISVGTRVIVLTLKNGLKVMDIANHSMEYSLEKWIEYLDLTTKYGIAKAELKDLYNRVINDAKATYYLSTFMENFYYNECGIPLQLTVASAAMKLFTMKFFTDYWENDSDFIARYEREAYYGGRTELFRRGDIKTWSYDVNSMYLSVMESNLIPDISTTKYIEKPPKNWRRYLDDYLGVWNVRVKTPKELYIPVLPVRIDGKLKFPCGEFNGKWCSCELLEAEKAGYKIIQVFNFIYYRHSKYYFQEFARFIWGKRKEYKEKGLKPMAVMVKKMGNSLYGKFAQRNSNEFFGKLTEFKGDIPPVCQFLEYNGETWLLVKGELTPAKFEFPVVSAFITAYARIKLYRAMHANKETIIYCDTDSIKLIHPAVGIEIGKGLGQFGIELENTEITYHRPKLYGDKRKGVPKRAVKIAANAHSETWKFDKPLRYREAIKKGLSPNIWVEILKTLEYQDDKRDWIGNQSKAIIFNN